MPQSPPLTGIRVLEFAGLAPGPYAGLLLADYGASVLRIDRAHPRAHGEKLPPPTADQLTRHKSSITVNTKSKEGIKLIKSLIAKVDVVIDPFRPGVLEKMGLDPGTVMLTLNPRVIVARMTGFRRDGKYAAMAGHDINYLAVSGVLSMLGRQGETPYAPGNVLGDFGGGGAVCFIGILLALLHRERTGLGQVVEANMVDGAAHLASMPRFCLQTPMWDGERGTNVLDGGCPYYDTYETKDGKYMAVGALEPQFYSALLQGLGFDPQRWPDRLSKSTWKEQREAFTRRFKDKTRSEWEAVFDGTDACCTPVLEQREMQRAVYDQRPIVTLTTSPGLAIAEGNAETRTAAQGQGGGVPGSGWTTRGLRPSEGGEAVLAQWMGWSKGREYRVKDGGLESTDATGRANL